MQIWLLYFLDSLFDNSLDRMYAVMCALKKATFLHLALYL